MADALAAQLSNTKLEYVSLRPTGIVERKESSHKSCTRGTSTDTKWKEQLNVPPKDTRPQTEVRLLFPAVGSCQTDCVAGCHRYEGS